MEPIESAGLSRRRALQLGASGLLVGAGVQFLDGAGPADAAARHKSLPAWAKRWHGPIRSIDNFMHRSRHTPFPHNGIMLTIDDGPSREWTPRYLRLLAKYDVKATFCMIGEQVHPNRHVAKDVAEHGHVIANHTWDHDEALAHKSARHISSNIWRTSHAIHTLTGFAPSQFRAPGGNWAQSIFVQLARQHLMPLGWNIDPRDWARPGTGAIEHAMLATRRHDIILCHDGGGNRSETYHALTKVIPTLLHRGYKFVTLPAPQPHV
jgi:peptidoglycan-N-acetylglucosamine deacetylase